MAKGIPDIFSSDGEIRSGESYGNKKVFLPARRALSLPPNYYDNINNSHQTSTILRLGSHVLNDLPLKSTLHFNASCSTSI